MNNEALAEGIMDALIGEPVIVIIAGEGITGKLVAFDNLNYYVERNPELMPLVINRARAEMMAHAETWADVVAKEGA